MTLMAREVIGPTPDGPVAVVIDGVSVENIVSGDPFPLAYRVLTIANHYTDRKYHTNREDVASDGLPTISGKVFEEDEGDRCENEG
jgi:hypothetical protein